MAGRLRQSLGATAGSPSEADFCHRLQIRDGDLGVAELETRLLSEVHQFLPGGGTGSELAQLLELVSSRATSLAPTQRLVHGDVLVALRVTAEEIFPAPNKIDHPDSPVRTPDLALVVSELKTGTETRLLVTAVGGVGKSVLATQIGPELPAGSVAIVYDCFAGGDYRKASNPRHTPRVALTQISNELAAHGLCTPLIPASADDSAYVRAFMQRIVSASEQLGRLNSDALLTIVIDAADNAAVAAELFQQRSFVPGLLREAWPHNARLVVLCRPERKHLLEVPQLGVLELALAGFGREETYEHLRSRFPDATEPEAGELHALSSGNPRVQAMAMDGAEGAIDVIEALQITSQRPGYALDILLDQQIRRIVDSGHWSENEVRGLCEALATLHPSIPLTDLASITQLSETAIRSFVAEIGRSLHMTETTVQFRDEPTETWFRTHFRLDPPQRRALADVVGVHADQSPYLANALPQLMLEANMLDELVTLALSDRGLPGVADQLQTQEIARSRARFALGATLRADRRADAARLAIKSGALSSGRSRRLNLFRTHADLTSRFMGIEFIESICALRELASDWPGSNLPVEAVLLANADELKDLARARYRSATDNVIAVLQAADDDDRHLHRKITVDVVADLAFAAASLDGPEGLLDFLGRWRPEEFVGELTEKVCSRLADAGRVDHLEHLIASPGPSHIQVAVADVMFAYGIAPSRRAAGALAAVLKERDTPFEASQSSLSQQPDPSGVVWAVVHGLRERVLEPADAARIIECHTPASLPDHIGSRWSGSPALPLVLALGLRASLASEPLDLNYVASPELAEALNSKATYSESQNAREFRANVEPMLPWIDCWIRALLNGPTDDVKLDFETLVSKRLAPVRDYDTPFVLHNSVAEIAARVLAIIDSPELAAAFARWHSSAILQLGRSRLRVLRLAARTPHLMSHALELLAISTDSVQQRRTDSDERIESLIDLARTVLSTNEAEAKALFELAVQEAERVGDDLYARWEALLGAADALATGAEPSRAYRLFQIAESLSDSESVHAAGVGDRLVGMHTPTYFTVASRARDRRTLSFQRVVSAAFRTAGTDGASTGRLALYGFGPDVNWRQTVDTLSEPTLTEAKLVLSDFTRYWSNEDSDEDHHASPMEYGVSALNQEDADNPNLASRLADRDLDFTTGEGWSIALDELSWGDERRELAAIALANHPTQKPAVLHALTESPRASRGDYAAIAEEAAEEHATPAVRAALAELATQFAVRFAQHLSTLTYDDEYLSAITASCQITVQHLRKIAFRELAGSAHDLGYTDCFRLASILTQLLDEPSARVVFDDLAALFDDISPADSASDGPYSGCAAPPSDEPSCIAGLIWSALGDMSPKIRWQAAHVTLLLVKLKCDDVLEALKRFADGSIPTTAFVDSRLDFYSLHARTWLLLAIARATHEPDPTPVASYAGWLVEVVRAGRHAANQLLAQRALVRLADDGAVALAGDDIDALTTPTTAAWTEMDWRERNARSNPLQAADKDDIDDEDDDFRFFLDFDGWCREVAEVFGCSDSDVLRRSSEAVAAFDGFENFSTRTDPRRELGIYGEGGGYSDGRSWPEEESLYYYLAVHALLTVGAELAAAYPGYKDPESDFDAYTDWLAGYLPLRRDGRWLSDRRDAPPTPHPDAVLATAAQAEEWPWNMSKADFDRVAGVGQEWITVSAYVDNDRDRNSEDVQVESALVSPETAEALIVALQTLPQGGYTLPTTDGFDYPTEPPYELVPWLNGGQLYQGLDELDERGAGIRFPPTRPSESVVQEFSLSSNADMRAWEADETTVFRSRVWKYIHRASRDREEGTRGESLAVQVDFLKTLLRSRNRYLAAAGRTPPPACSALLRAKKGRRR